MNVAESPGLKDRFVGCVVMKGGETVTDSAASELRTVARELLTWTE
jgi:hypothetical protein